MGTIQIHDARRVREKSGFRVKIIGKNGEILQVSEVLNTKASVGVHLSALLAVFLESKAKMWLPSNIADHTKNNVFKTFLLKRQNDNKQ
jgi:hypothetical protein